MIIQNAVYVKQQDTYYVSRHRHDYVTINVEGHEFSIDGGNEYFRSGGNTEMFKKFCRNFSLTDKSTIDQVRRRLLWGKKTRQGHIFRPICKLTTSHLKAILETQHHISPLYKYIVELNLRIRDQEKIAKELEL